MAINPNCGEVISIDDAKKLVDAFKAKFPNEIQCSLVGIEKVNLILNQQGCEGIRIYYGYNQEEQKISPVLVGVDGNGEDIMAVLVDKLRPCPDECPTDSRLINK